MTRWCMTWRSSACRCGSPSTAPGWWVPTAPPMPAADEAELVHMVATAAALDDRPSAFRFPRGEGTGVELPERGTPLEIGRGRIVAGGGRVAILSFGARLAEVLAARESLAARGL